MSIAYPGILFSSKISHDYDRKNTTNLVAWDPEACKVKNFLVSNCKFIGTALNKRHALSEKQNITTWRRE